MISKIFVAYIYSPSSRPFELFLLFSLALFAYWLRSSVVSVLFSLISEIVLLDKSMIKSIFEISLGTAEFTHVPGHSVSGITLPPDDATFIFITFLACPAL